MQLGEAIREFLVGLKGVRSPATLKWYQSMLVSLTPLECVELNAITAEVLRKVWGELADRKERYVNGDHPVVSGGLSPATLAGYYRAIRTFFKFCVEQEYISKNPMKKLKRPLLPNQPPKAIADADLNRLLDATSCKRDYAIVCLLAVSNCRRGGLQGMKVQDIDDLNLGRLWVTEKGPGGGKRRAIYVHGHALAALKDYLFNERRWGVCDHVFVVQDGSRELSLTGLREVLRRLARRSGVKRRWNPHAFRHRWARNAIENGMDLGTVSQLMGHSGIDVTDRFYGRWADEELRVKHQKFVRLPSTNK